MKYHRQRASGILGIIAFALFASSPTLAVAQQTPNVLVGARIRTYGDRATDEGVRHFRLTGSLVTVDSVRLTMRQEPASSTGLDTIALIGIHRLEVFRELRSRRGMILKGAAIGGITGIAVWRARA